MINATFTKKHLWNTFFLFGGLFAIGLFVFIGYTDPDSTMAGVLSGVILGAILCLFGILSLLFNFRAYLYIKDDHIKGRYHFFGKISCEISDIAFAQAYMNTLTILLRSGKRYGIVGIGNSAEFCSAIRRATFQPETDAPGNIRRELAEVQAAQKKRITYVIVGIALMFATIFAGVFLTGSRELYDFTKLDWCVFAGMWMVEVLIAAATFYFAGKSSKNHLSVDHLSFRLQGAIIASQPLPSGNPIRVYTDENYSGRLVVFGFPNEDGVYYCVQSFSGREFRLDTVYTSEIYENENALRADADLSPFIDITQHFL